MMSSDERNFSTKELRVITPPSGTSLGIGRFKYTDNYSVFHYGRMPDLIPGKGEAICRMAVYNFKLLDQYGVRHHFRRIHAPNTIEVDLVDVLEPNEIAVQSRRKVFFVPLQVIYRNSLPMGSSVWRRLKGGQIEFEQWGLSSYHLSPGDKLPHPIVEFTTKERVDRYIPFVEAKAISGLSDEQMHHLINITLWINEIITAKAESVGLEHADGKIEFGVTAEGDLMVVDSVGTPDENRFLYKGHHIGKQFLRDYYASQEFGKQMSVITSVKSTVPWPTPDKLPARYLSLASEMYKSICEKWTGQKLWKTLGLDQIVDTLPHLSL